MQLKADFERAQSYSLSLLVWQAHHWRPLPIALGAATWRHHTPVLTWQALGRLTL